VIALDASALLAFLFREPGQEIVAQELGKSCISSVNLAEVLVALLGTGTTRGWCLTVFGDPRWTWFRSWARTRCSQRRCCRAHGTSAFLWETVPVLHWQLRAVSRRSRRTARGFHSTWESACGSFGRDMRHSECG